MVYTSIWAFMKNFCIRSDREYGGHFPAMRWDIVFTVCFPIISAVRSTFRSFVGPERSGAGSRCGGTRTGTGRSEPDGARLEQPDIQSNQIYRAGRKRDDPAENKGQSGGSRNPRRRMWHEPGKC